MISTIVGIISLVVFCGSGLYIAKNIRKETI